jgi:hypothetical protein
MNTTLRSMPIVGMATALILLASSALGAEADAPKTATADGKQAESATPLFSYTPPVRGAPVTRVGGGTRGGETYMPPLRGAPESRVGGGTRGIEAVKLSLDVLAPGATGYTLREKPTVYWYVSERITNPVELTVIGADSIAEGARPLLDIELKPPIEKGVHALSLAQYGIELKPDHEYQWFVAIVRNPAQRSSDILAGGQIRRVAESKAIETKIAQSAKATWPAIYAESGVWYDAIDELSKMINADPGNRGLRAQRAALLDQVGLPDAAKYDRSAGR